jgi:hypothetical protein
MTFSSAHPYRRFTIKPCRRLFVGILAMSIAAAAGMALGASTAPAPPRIHQLVASLSWDSVAEECHWFWWVAPRGPVAEELIRIGKPATTELLAALVDPNRAAAAHLILCAIYNSPSNCTGRIDDTSLPFKYQFGMLKFTSKSRAGEPLSPKMLIANQKAWRRLFERPITTPSD